MAVNIGQPAANAVVVVGELFVIDTQQVQCRGMQVVGISWVFSSLEPERIARPVCGSTLDATSSQPSRESPGVVIAPFIAPLKEWLPAKVRGAYHQRIVEQTPRFKVS